MRQIRNRSIVERLVIPGLVLASLFSCKTQNLFQEEPASTRVSAKQQDAAKKAAADSIFLAGAATYQYTIRTDDKISISIWNNDDISVGSVYGIYNSAEGYGKWLMVDAEGEIAMPQIGSLKVRGLTIPAMRVLVTDILSRTVKSPIVDIKVLNKEVTVLGEVKIPGKIHLEKDRNTLVEILGQAGDFDLYGNKRKVQVLRTVNDTIRTMVLDLTHSENLAANNILIHPGDIVYVPAKQRKQWDKTASSTIVPAASAITAILLIFKTFF
jgi:polysaccharide biosynthesis/export protein